MEKEKTVGERKDFLYLKGHEDFLIFYKKVLEILVNEFKFDRVSEKGPIRYFPERPKVGPKIIAIKEKDPRTNIEITIKFGFKQPLAHHKTSKDVFLVLMSFSGTVITKYKKQTTYQRSFLNTWTQKILEGAFFKKERDKYAEECEELIEAVRIRARETYDEIPSIGRSSRKYYKPTW